MHISALNQKIIFQKIGVVVDKIGNHTNSWNDYYTCYATISGEGGNEEAVVGQTVENAELCFTVRYCQKVSAIKSSEYRIIFNDEFYDILAIDHFSYKKKAVKFKCRKARR